MIIVNTPEIPNKKITIEKNRTKDLVLSDAANTVPIITPNIT